MCLSTIAVPQCFLVACSVRVLNQGQLLSGWGWAHYGRVCLSAWHTHTNICTQTDSCSVVRRQCANRCPDPDRHIFDNRWRLPISLETLAVGDLSLPCFLVGCNLHVQNSPWCRHLFLLKSVMCLSSHVVPLFLSLFSFYHFVVVSGDYVLMHSSLPKSIDVLSFYIIKHDRTIGSKAIFCNLKLFSYTSMFF